jgi:hypothetical protein
MTLGAGKPLDQFSGQRQCRYPTCEARLSRYNPDTTCAAHGGWDEAKPSRRARRRRQAIAN